MKHFRSSVNQIEFNKTGVTKKLDAQREVSYHVLCFLRDMSLRDGKLQLSNDIAKALELYRKQDKTDFDHALVGIKDANNCTGGGL